MSLKLGRVGIITAKFGSFCWTHTNPNMRTNVPVLFSVLAFGASLIPVHAIPVTFNLRDTAATAEIESGLINRVGIQATLTPSVAGGSGALNQTGSGFGVDATGDDTDRIDAGGGVESISIVFDTDVLLTGLNLSDFTTSETALLTIASFPALTLTGQSAANDIYSFSANNLILAGQTLVLKWGSGNGFSFDSFTVDPVPRPVPDSSPGFIGWACAILMFIGFYHRWKLQPVPARARRR